MTFLDCLLLFSPLRDTGALYTGHTIKLNTMLSGLRCEYNNLTSLTSISIIASSSACVMTEVPKRTFQCPHCVKTYRRKRDYDLHRNVCSILTDAGVGEREVELRQDTMTHHQLCDLVKMLVKEQTSLKDQVKSLKQQLATIRKKVTAEEYLAQGVHPEHPLDAFSDKLKMTADDFAYLLEEKLEPTLERLVNHAAPSIEEVPLRTFTGTGGVVYCYDNAAVWRRMNGADWSMVTGKVTKSLLEQLKDWTDANEHRLGEDAFSLRYNTYVQKVMSCIPKIQPKLTAMLSQRVKVSLNSVTTFEFKLS